MHWRQRVVPGKVSAGVMPPQNSVTWTGAAPPATSALQQVSPGGSGSPGSGYERYVISRTAGGGWQWQLQQQGTASHPGSEQPPAHGTVAPANPSQYRALVDGFKSAIHNLWRGHMRPGRNAAAGGRHRGK